MRSELHESEVSSFSSGLPPLPGWRLLSLGCFQRAFTLLEVMIAVAFIGIALLALLSLHHNDLTSVARARDLTSASMLAQSLMADSEVSRFPNPGQTSGDFERMFPGLYRQFRWQRKVERSEQYPDVCRVRVTVLYGPRFRRTFVLTEFMHNPMAQFNLLNQQNSPGTPGENGPDTQQ